MTRASVILLAAVLTTTALPAMADWERIGSLNVAAGKNEQFSMEFFKGNVIGLTARDSDIVCDRVTATMDNGELRSIFKGKLPKGLSVRVDLPPGTVTRVNFECRPAAMGEAVIDLAADAGATAPESRG
jgi:hypothetical protein